MKPHHIGRKRLGFQRLVSRHPTHQVERVGPEEPSDFPAEAIWLHVRKLYRTGLHPAIALNIRHRGKLVLNRTIGHLSNPVGGVATDVVTPDSLFSLFSASKIVTATLVMALVEDGVISLNDRVVDYLPEFGRHGKDGIRIRHLLQHTAGIPNLPPIADIEATFQAGTVDLGPIFDLKPLSKPGERTAYHSIAGWQVLQAIVELVMKRPLPEVLRARLLDPLGIQNLTYGTDPERAARVARHATTGLKTPRFMSSIFTTNIGLDFDKAVELTNRDGFHTAVLPSANIVATPDEVGRFMEMLRMEGELDGVRVLKPETVRRMVTDVTPVRIDGTYRLPMRYGLGVMMGGDYFSLFGLGTKGVFGHLGLSNLVAYADPSRELSVAYLTTGKPMFAPGMVQWYRVMQRIANLVPRTASRS